jgi:hypothetical protein
MEKNAADLMSLVKEYPKIKVGAVRESLNKDKFYRETGFLFENEFPIDDNNIVSVVRELAKRTDIKDVQVVSDLTKLTYEIYGR